MAEWVKFDGRHEEKDGKYRLTSKSGKGVIEVEKKSVKVDGGSVQVEVGAKVHIVEAPPPQKDRSVSAEELEKMKLNGCRKTQCVGLLLICCDNGAVIGPCIGAWGC